MTDKGLGPDADTTTIPPPRRDQTTYTIRFIGDPIGYVVTTDRLNMVDRIVSAPCWIRAYVGISNRTVQIDAAKAYRIDEEIAP